MRVRATAWSTSSSETQRSTWSAASWFVVLLAACSGATEKVEHPEPKPTRPPAPAPAATAEAPPPAAPSYTPAVSCDVRGTPVIAKGVSLWGEPTGTNALAGFAGQPVTLI